MDDLQTYLELKITLHSIALNRLLGAKENVILGERDKIPSIH